MKLRTILSLGIGYAVGAKLGPSRLESIAREIVASEEKASSGGFRDFTASKSEPKWPDSSFSA